MSGVMMRRLIKCAARRRAPKGVLRVSASVLFGQHYIAPVILKYLDQYPDVKVDAVFVDRLVDIVDEGFDVAVRIGPLSDSSMMAVRVGAVRRVVCGCPSYFKEHGLPQKPEDLQAHQIVSASPVSHSNEWMFAGGQRVRVQAAIGDELDWRGN